jgi:hypothetical protein
MSQRTLQPGETLRVRSRGRVLVLRADAAWEVRIVRRGLAVRIARWLLARWLRMHRFGAAARGFL